MTISIKHAFISLKGDGTDATQVQPSNWNAGHSNSMASGNLIGRLSAGVGPFEEIPISAYMANLLQAADAATLAGLLGLWTTGDVKYTFASAAPGGWITVSQAGSSSGLTIGNAASGANIRANADTQALFVLLYTNCSDALAPVSGGRTGNAVNDFNSNKTITIPQLGGRSPIGAGAAGAQTTAKTLGTLYGAETTNLAANQIPSLTSSGVNNISVSGTVFGAPYIINTFNTGTAPNPCNYMGTTNYSVTCTGNNNISVAYTNASQQSLSLMDPKIALNVMVKL